MMFVDSSSSLLTLMLPSSSNLLSQVHIDGLAAGTLLWNGIVIVFNHGIQAVSFLHVIGHAAPAATGSTITVMRLIHKDRPVVAGEELMQAGCSTEWQLSSRSRMEVPSGTGVTG